MDADVLDDKRFTRRAVAAGLFLFLFGAWAVCADPAPPVVRAADAMPDAKTGEVKARAGRIVVLNAETPAKVVRWAICTDGADLIPGPDGKSAAFVAPNPGRYLVLSWTAAGDVPSEATRTVIVIGDPPQPMPPGPIPPPRPVDTLKQTLAAAYSADTAPDRADHLRMLVALYDLAPRTARDATLTTIGEVVGKVKEAGKLLVGDGLTKVRQAIADHLAGVFTADGPLDDPTREKLATEYTRVRDALKEIK